MKLPKKHVTTTCAQPVGWRDSLNTRQREYGQLIPMHTLWKLDWGRVSARSSCAPSAVGNPQENSFWVSAPAFSGAGSLFNCNDIMSLWRYRLPQGK